VILGSETMDEMQRPIPTADEFYSEAFVNELVKVYSLFDVSKPNLRQSINDNARQYHREKAAIEDALPNKQCMQILESLTEDSVKLRDKIDALPPEVWELMSDASRNVVPNAWVGRVGFDPVHPSLTSGFSEPSVTIQKDVASGEQDKSVTIAELLDALSVLSEVASVATQAYRNKQGRQPDHALENWIRNTSFIWLSSEKRQFTQDSHSGGEPVSDAARFCVDLFVEIDTRTPKTRVIHEMKKLIKKMNKHPRWRK
jgi:hypothetical protein